MIKCIAFLRGINVGGHRLIPMETLRQLFTSMGFERAKTYIQSGNVIFETREIDTNRLEKDIEKHLLQALGYEVPVLIRTDAQVSEVVRNNPFADRLAEEKAKLYVAFLTKEPGDEATSSLLSFNGEVENYRIQNREVYCLLHKAENDRRRYALDSLEKILGVSATLRNWATVNKVLSL